MMINDMFQQENNYVITLFQDLYYLINPEDIFIPKIPPK